METFHLQQSTKKDEIIDEFSAVFVQIVSK